MEHENHDCSINTWVGKDQGIWRLNITKSLFPTSKDALHDFFSQFLGEKKELNIFVSLFQN